MFCREHGNLRPDEVAALLSACLPAYYESLASPQAAPHARYDITEDGNFLFFPRARRRPAFGVRDAWMPSTLSEFSA